MSPVRVHFKTSKRWSSSSLTFSTLRNEKLSPTSIIQTFCVLVKAKCFKKMPHKMWTHSQRIISTTRGQESEDSTSVWASVSSMRNLFASLDQFGQTNFNHSHSNEPIRKYTVWPLNPKYLHLLRSSPVQKLCTPTRATAAATPQLQCGALPPAQDQFEGQWFRIQFAPGAVSRAQSGCCVHIHRRIRPTSTKTTTKYAFFLSAVCVCATFLQSAGPFQSQLYCDSKMKQFKLHCLHLGEHPWTAIREVVAVFWQLEKRQINTTSALLENLHCLVSQTNALWILVLTISIAAVADGAELLSDPHVTPCTRCTNADETG